MSGFTGTATTRVALQKREINAFCSQWESMRVTARAMLDAQGDDKLIPFVVSERWEDPEVKDLPLLKDVIKDPIFVVGYSGPELDPALARGEIDARINNADTVLTRNVELLKTGAIVPHIIMEVPQGFKHHYFSNLPEIESFAKSERERKLLHMVRAFRQFGTPSILPPGTPKEQVEILKAAMVKTFTDPEFPAEYKKFIGDEATPLMPEEIEKTLKELPRDPETIALFKKLNAAGPLPVR